LKVKALNFNFNEFQILIKQNEKNKYSYCNILFYANICVWAEYYI
jgi:hypothetical protein